MSAAQSERQRCDTCGRMVRLTMRRVYYGRIRVWVGHSRDCAARKRAGAAPVVGS